MINQNNTAEDILRDFHRDTKRWKSMLEYKENEISFINRLLSSKAFKGTTPNLFERLEKFKDEGKNYDDKTKNLKKEISEYANELKGFLECDDISCDTFYFENHEVLKNRFEEFYLEFNEYKTKVFNYTGGVL
ncbi:hypothetical protein [Eudoraea sp.]|uniref:hypothetical protein n=1 Tax=Eudoraea sp. TaxID=1979955 RepID=UPI003C77027C